MTIERVNSLAESYRHRARATDINELNGRGQNRQLTDFITKNVVAALPDFMSGTAVDIGCGDCSLFKEIIQNCEQPENYRLIGVLPTTEEIKRVYSHIVDDKVLQNSLVTIQQGTVCQVQLVDNCADVVIVNSVLHGAAVDADTTIEALREFKRILRPGGTLFIGELPDCDEFADRNYRKNSIISWLCWILREKGWSAFFKNAKKVMLCTLGAEPFIIEPKEKFFAAPQTFTKMLQSVGFDCNNYQRHKEINEAGEIVQSMTRWNYIATAK